MKTAMEFLINALRFGGAVAEIIRDRRRAGDTRPARVIWDEVRSTRAWQDASRDKRRAKGWPEREE